MQRRPAPGQLASSLQPMPRPAHRSGRAAPIASAAPSSCAVGLLPGDHLAGHLTAPQLAAAAGPARQLRAMTAYLAAAAGGPCNALSADAFIEHASGETCCRVAAAAAPGALTIAASDGAGRVSSSEQMPAKSMVGAPHLQQHSPTQAAVGGPQPGVQDQVRDPVEGAAAPLLPPHQGGERAGVTAPAATAALGPAPRGACSVVLPQRSLLAAEAALGTAAAHAAAVAAQAGPHCTGGSALPSPPRGRGLDRLIALSGLPYAPAAALGVMQPPPLGPGLLAGGLHGQAAAAADMLEVVGGSVRLADAMPPQPGVSGGGAATDGAEVSPPPALPSGSTPPGTLLPLFPSSPQPLSPQDAHQSGAERHYPKPVAPAAALQPPATYPAMLAAAADAGAGADAAAHRNESCDDTALPPPPPLGTGDDELPQVVGSPLELLRDVDGLTQLAPAPPGALGSTWQGTWCGRPVAVKLVCCSAWGGPEAPLLRAACRAARRVHHPNLVPVHAVPSCASDSPPPPNCAASCASDSPPPPNCAASCASDSPPLPNCAARRAASCASDSPPPPNCAASCASDSPPPPNCAASCASDSPPLPNCVSVPRTFSGRDTGSSCGAGTALNAASEPAASGVACVAAAAAAAAGLPAGPVIDYSAGGAGAGAGVGAGPTGAAHWPHSLMMVYPGDLLPPPPLAPAEHMALRALAALRLQPGGCVVAVIRELCDMGNLCVLACSPQSPFRAATTWPLHVALRALLRTAREGAAGAAALHEAGVPHGALTPTNVLLTASSRDRRGFVARVSEPCSPGLGTTAGDALAAVAPAMLFMAPELLSAATAHTHPPSGGGGGDGHCRSPPVHECFAMAAVGAGADGCGVSGSVRAAALAAGCAADVYTFGMLLYLMAAGETPFAGEHLVSALMAVSTEGRRPEWPAGQHDHLEPLYRGCVAADPAQRPSMSQVYQQVVALEAQVKAAKAAKALPPPAPYPGL
ncbi:hypothetical protein HXX76_013315 [Chlamydomonas incerta]|uniref:Protein kinase domain-containing protein n=1 Tax=Chlamydomonas incerta TaxID=51695 RepID=A0A835SJ75_CHLIN|nr:hypothetical protein HXX76_013315 [Chlamydomonas incerta]|eukprot:KAG2425942.1 hypothetical protein HXX76_013315 [Chlamydomonas incerta]